VAGSARRRRGRRHPGVVLLKPDPKRRIGWRARYVDPDSGRTIKESLDPALRSAELREDWAIRKSKALARRRLELEGGAPRTTGTELGDAVKRYFEDHPILRERTREIYRRASDKFVAWCTRHGIKSADEVTGPRLVAFRATLVKEPKRKRVRGKRGAVEETRSVRAPATVNQELRALGTVLTYIRRLGLLPMISSDHIRDGLTKLALSVERIDFRKPPELRALLDASIKHDAATFEATREEHAGKREAGTTQRHKPIVPFVCAAMLTGMRLGELLGLTWERVDLEAGHAGEIYVTAESKTKRARTVDLEVSPALGTMLRAIRPNNAAGSVFGLTRDEARTAERRLRAEYGAPNGCGFQALRRTCGTFLTNAPGIFGAASAYRSARQLGHSVQVAERHYLGVVHVDPNARTLESAMGIDTHPALG
jgi:integrase